ncbi:maleylpyruvate isomerase family mycothiol-dependent enzyme [Gulosibacter bifidus]|uniref:Maleylpyruvate isomerase family mycothiol-dependent enzyme n=1 Tax=Gulosibacter bifidus TaxID=272239 RepID=A0ABW5RG72_9MICO|nr:maleylpyruvate isomerase family mycothiol-dependent enzyme [Gulosibacter bifidus]
MANERESVRPTAGVIFSRPAKRVSGDWSAHIATTLDRLADLLDACSDAQWNAPSMCDDWRVRDVVGHLIWRLGNRTTTVARVGVISGSPKRTFAAVARDVAEAEPHELVAQLRAIAAGKLAGDGRTGLIELTEAIVHAYDITEALGLRLRLSPRSTGAVALAQVRLPIPLGKNRVARRHTLRAVDARWQIGRGSPIDATAGSIIMFLFGRIDRTALEAALSEYEDR